VELALPDGAAVLGDVHLLHRAPGTGVVPGTASDLVRCGIGAAYHRPRPGRAAQTWLAFRVEPPPPEPEPIPGTPSYAIVDPIRRQHPPPSTVDVPAGAQVRAVPLAASTAPPPVFETLAPIRAEVGWNALRARRTTGQRLTGRKSMRLAGVAVQLRQGDPLLFVQGARFETRAVAAVTRDNRLGITTVSWDAALTQVDFPEVSVMRQRLAVFGHNAPRGPQPFDPNGSDWEGLTISPDPAAIDLDGSHPEVLPHQSIVLALGGGHQELHRVNSVSELSRAQRHPEATRVKSAPARRLPPQRAPDRRLRRAGDAELAPTWICPQRAHDDRRRRPARSPPRQVLVSDGMPSRPRSSGSARCPTGPHASPAGRVGTPARPRRYGNVSRFHAGEMSGRCSATATPGRGAAFALRDGPLTYVGTDSTPGGHRQRCALARGDACTAGPADRAYVTRTTDLAWSSSPATACAVRASRPAATTCKPSTAREPGRRATSRRAR
jgi:hypothetical protein